MRPIHWRLSTVLAMVTLTLPAVAACGSDAAPVGSSSASPSVTATTPSPTPTPTPAPTTPAPTATTPAPGWTVVSARMAYNWQWPSGDHEGTVTHTYPVPPVGDFEGDLTYGIGITYPIVESNPQVQIRVYEVTYVNEQGVYRYVVAFDVHAR